MLFPFDVNHLLPSMLIFLGVETVVDVNHLLPSMLIFSLLVTGPKIITDIDIVMMENLVLYLDPKER
jgi:hypothetical protein